MIKIHIFSNMTPCRWMSSHRCFGGVFCPSLQDISNSQRPEEPLVTYRVFCSTWHKYHGIKKPQNFTLLDFLPQITSVWSTVRTCKCDVTLVPCNAEDFVNSWATTISSSSSFPEGYRSFGYFSFPLLMKSFAITVTAHWTNQLENQLSAGNLTPRYRLPQRVEPGRR